MDLSIKEVNSSSGEESRGNLMTLKKKKLEWKADYLITLERV